MKITEEQFENHLLGILAELGYVYENGYEIAPDTDRAEQKDWIIQKIFCIDIVMTFSFCYR